MKRRNVIKTISLGAGYTLSGVGFAAFISGCKQEGTIKATATEWAPSFMSKSHSGLVENILEAMLPKTDSSPGAKELNIIQVVDNVVNKLFNKEDQETFSEGLDALSMKFKSDFNVELDDIKQDHINGFMEKYMSPMSEEQDKKVKKLLFADKTKLSEADKADYNFINLLSTIREQGISAYFSNETIATEYLSYDPIPGAYIGCMPVSDVGNVWAL